MLKVASMVTTSDEINKLINNGNYKYLNLSSYRTYDMVKLDNNEENKISRVSVNDKGDILGYFSAGVNRSNFKLNGCFFVKFTYNFTNPEEDEKIADADFKEFIDFLMNHPIFTAVGFLAVEDNPANKTYEKFMEKYKGERFLLKNYIMLEDGKYYNVWTYWFDRR